jgi:hypothetical protein
MDNKVYTHEIWKRIRERIEMRYGARRATVISIVTPIIINGIAYFVFYRTWGFDVANQQISSFLLGTVILEIALLSSFLFSWRFYDIPEEIFKEQKERLNELEPDLTKIIIIEFSPFVPKNHVGIDIKNLTREDFDGVVELTKFSLYEYDEHCNEHETPLSIDADNCHLNPFKVKANDHYVIYLAELRDHRCVFLTEKTIPFDVNMFFGRPVPIPPPNYIKLVFGFEFRIVGKFKKESFESKYKSLIELNSEKYGTSGQETSIEIGNIEYVLKKSNAVMIERDSLS